MSLLHSIKNVRRRAVESIFQKTGYSEESLDEDFNSMYANIQDILIDLNECGTKLTAFLRHQKSFFVESQNLSNVVSQIYEHSLEQKYKWPKETNKLEHFEGALLWKQKWDKLDGIVRSSTARVCFDDALEPIKQTLNECTATLADDVKHRSLLLKDYDAHRRRLKGYQTKSETSGDISSNFDLRSDLSKFTAKVNFAGSEYDKINNKLKDEMIATKETHDELIETVLITLLTTQVHMFSKAAKELDEILCTFPISKVQSIRSRIGDCEIQSSCADIVKVENFSHHETVTPTPANQHQPLSLHQPTKQDVVKNIITETTTKVNPTAGLSRRKTPPPPAASRHVISLYDFQSNDKEDISFVKGDIIYVVDDSDANWWKGKIGGRIGMFPSNYVAAPAPAPTVGNSVTNKSVVATSQPHSRAAVVSVKDTLTEQNERAAATSAFALAASVFRNQQPSSIIKAGTGSAPTNTKQLKSPPQAAGPTTAGQRTATSRIDGMKQALALYSYQAREEGELSFQKGNVINVLEDSDPGWWKGKLIGSSSDTGVFPANYVQLKR